MHNSKGISQNELAKILKIDPATLSKNESEGESI
jgi:transcriptional regulator with XRE-family HTH domain